MSTDDKRDERDELLAAEYALGVLPHAERQAFAARLEKEPDLRRKTENWDQHLFELSDEIDPAAPRSDLLGTIEDRLFTPAPQPVSWWSSLGVWRGLTAASLAVAVTLGALYINQRPVGPGDARTYVSELAGENSPVRVVALYEPATGILKVNRIQGASATGRALELWLIEGSNKPVSLGVLPAAQSASLSVANDLRERFEDAVLAISDEPEGGSPTGQPTGAVLATGKMTKV